MRDASSDSWLVFRDPVCIVQTHRAREVPEKLRQIEAAVHGQGVFAAGFLAYEAAPGFDPALRVRADQSPGHALPLLWFGLYAGVEVMKQLGDPPDGHAGSISAEWTASISEHEYRACLDTIREHLRRGDTYQVNYSFRLHADLQADPWHFFQCTCNDQPPPHAAFVGLRDWALCSFSPELFFTLDDRSLLCKPMKGTRPRGRTVAEDRCMADELRQSVKDRAENVMITDMVRNDLGRLALPGTVKPFDLFTVEKHATVWQMTSSITAQTDSSLPGIFKALFPPASITGAPKAATMGIIADLEASPRRIYTGCIGYIGPGRKAAFNVAIRTVLVDRRRGYAEYGVGGGIVWDSNAKGEFEECRTKARVLSRRVPRFDLLETVLWEADQGYVLLERHLARLGDSAEYFDYPLDMEAVRTALGSLAANLAAMLPGRSRMVRLLLDRRGNVRLEEHLPPPSTGSVPDVVLAAEAVDSSDPFLFHKTTHRLVYEKALAGRPGVDDVLLYNERGEITESTRANVAVRLNGELHTPPVSCGLLAGTMRAHLLEQGAIMERVLTPADVRRAEEILLINSVRGIRTAKYVGEQADQADQAGLADQAAR